MEVDAGAAARAFVATTLLILLNGLYVLHEFSFVTLRPPDVHRLAASHSWAGRLVERGRRHLDHYLAVDQLAITATSIAVGWVGQPVFGALLTRLFGAAGPLAATLAGTVLSFALITGAQMVVGELVPKTVALRLAPRVAPWVALPVEVTAWLVSPVVWVLNGAGRGLARLLGVPVRRGEHRVLPVEELVRAIDVSVRAGTLSADPTALRLALQFSDLRAADVMRPRPDVVALDRSYTLQQVLAIARREKHTRFPVYEGNPDNVVGILNVKELLQPGPQGEARVVEEWQQLVRPALTLPESAPIEEVFTRLRQARQHLAVLVDEYGGVAGIVSISDLIGHLVGPFEQVKLQPDGSYLVLGQVSLAKLEAVLNLPVDDPEAGAETVGGLIMQALGRIPAPGDRVHFPWGELEVVRVEGRRVVTARLRLQDGVTRETAAGGLGAG